jgi:Formyltetrahydrofolate synthetase
LELRNYFNIKCRKAGLTPKLTIIVATAQGLKMHGGVDLAKIKEPDMDGLVKGFENLDKHIANMRSFGQNVMVAFNRYSFDTDEEVEAIAKHCKDMGVRFVVNDAFAKGGEGAIDLANVVIDEIEKNPSKQLTFTYQDNESIKEKIEKIAHNLYGAGNVLFSDKALKMLNHIDELGVNHYPVCIAKTQYSFSADPKAYGVVKGFDFKINDIVINNGAEFIVAIAGEIMRMPGLPKVPQANFIDIVDGNVEGLS